jgi:hypothetical protein
MFVCKIIAPKPLIYCKVTISIKDGDDDDNNKDFNLVMERLKLASLMSKKKTLTIKVYPLSAFKLGYNDVNVIVIRTKICDDTSTRVYLVCMISMCNS